ncbi:MAG: FCD domain-containing protein [Acidiferrobacterales bacterium]|nr:FCD domain-containing protein [Acidiferrobacterales bacterium]
MLGNNLINDDFSREISAFELLEARVLLEGEAAALAAHMRTEEEVTALAEALRKIQLEDIEDNTSAGADRQFHAIIAQATHNRVILKQIQFLWDIQENLGHIKAAHQSVCIKERDSRITDHKAIFTAIEAGDSSKARDCMRYHFKDLLQAMHEETERQAVEAAKKKGFRNARTILAWWFSQYLDKIGTLNAKLYFLAWYRSQ